LCKVCETLATLFLQTGTRFTQGEGVAFDTAASVQRYDLSVLGNSYALYANGNYQSAILSGLLRDYTPEGSPYTISNFLFLGDNTTSARGKFKIDTITLTNEAIAATPVPVPGLLPGLVPAFLLAGWRIVKKTPKSN
jgi:hypothetical protein